MARSREQRREKAPKSRFVQREREPRQTPMRRSAAPLQAQTAAQARYMAAIASNTITFGIGPAGTGKTFIAATMAADLLERKEIRRIIITRPAVEAGESLGFLPGELDEKYEPFFRPVRDVLERRMGAGALEYMVKAKTIEALPLAYMRGMTLDDAFILLDEAQNTTPTQMKLFLTRIGENATVVVDGDLSQKDIPGPSGLIDAARRLQGLPGVGFVTFTEDDVVRSGIVQDIVRRYQIEEADDKRYIDERDGLLRMLKAA